MFLMATTPLNPSSCRNQLYKIKVRAAVGGAHGACPAGTEAASIPVRRAPASLTPGGRVARPGLHQAARHRRRWLSQGLPATTARADHVVGHRGLVGTAVDARRRSAPAANGRCAPLRSQLTTDSGQVTEKRQ